MSMAFIESIRDELAEDMWGRRVMNNSARAMYVERMVLRAIQIADAAAGWRYSGGDWLGWDIDSLETKVRVEVKASAARHSWSTEKSKPSRAAFDIAKRDRYYLTGEDLRICPAEWNGRPADIYVFAWHADTDLKMMDQRSPDGWTFLIVRARDLPDKKTAGLVTLRKCMAAEVRYDKLGVTGTEIAASLGSVKSSLAGAVADLADI